MKDFAERLEKELKWRYAACEDHAATPSSILLAVLNAVAAARLDDPNKVLAGELPERRSGEST